MIYSINGGKVQYCTG